MTTWTKTAWAEGSSTMTGSLSDNAKVDLVVTPGQRLRNWWCVLWRLFDLGRVGGGSLRLCLSFVQAVWFLDPVSLINWVNSFYLFGRWIRPLYSSKKNHLSPVLDAAPSEDKGGKVLILTSICSRCLTIPKKTVKTG